MSHEHGNLTLAMGVGASLALGGLAFVPTAGNALRAPAHLRATPAGAAGNEPQRGAGAGLAATCSLAACALAVGAVSRPAARRAGGVAARAKVLTIDESGRYRFATPLKPLIPSEQPGATAPLGFWDPLGFSKDPLMTFPDDPNGFRHLRAAEIKHGRVAMMASIGSLFAHFVKAPGAKDVPTGLAALGTADGAAGFAVLVACVGFFEACNWTQKAGPGNYGDPFNLNQYTTEMRNRELNNGRMAMFAVMGQFAAEALTGEDPALQLGI